MEMTDSPPTQKKKVFICYAREDEKAAIRLYEGLKNAGLLPWRDKIAILPGENYKIAIRRAIKESRYFIPLLSSISVQKIGFLQKELRYAIDNFDKFPESEIYIIPARLDDCKIPFERLEDIEYVDLFPNWDSGLNRIFEALHIEELPIPPIPSKPIIKKGLSDAHWKELLTSINSKKCVPFIGPNINTVQNEDGKEPISLFNLILERWKQKVSSHLGELNNLEGVRTLGDTYQLARVAQFTEIGSTEYGYSKRMLTNMLREIHSSDLSYDRSPYDSLARLDLPIYLTTNYDRFMEEALSRNGRKKTESDFCKWSQDLTKYTKAAGIKCVFEDPYFKPTDESPLVYHINGDMETPESLVLTEKDYFEFVINLNKADEKEIMPPIIRTELATSTLLFIGYAIDDINFRSIFQGFLSYLSSLSSEYRKTSIAVQIPPGPSGTDQAKIQDYLEKYTNNMFHVNVYWGSTTDFVRELDGKWQEFKSN